MFAFGDHPISRTQTRRSNLHSSSFSTDANTSDVKDDDADGPPVKKRPRRTVARSQLKLSGNDSQNSPKTPRTSSSKGEEDGGDFVDTKFLSAKPRNNTSATPRAPKLSRALSKAHPAPPRWEETYSIVRTQRQFLIAPVDTMGCDTAASSDASLPPQSPKEKRLSILVSLMLSSQTKDEVTAAAVVALRKTLPGGLTLVSLCAATEEQIHACINKVGFWRRKTEYILLMAQTLREKHEGDVPKTLEGLVALKGVGPKMAYLCLASAWGINEGIGVDVHVHRITNRLGWHKPRTVAPEGTRVNLESWLPKDKHQEINHMLVGFGQLICLPVRPRCDLCDLAPTGLCPSTRSVSKSHSAASSPRKTQTSPLRNGGEAKIKVELDIEMGIVDGR